MTIERVRMDGTKLVTKDASGNITGINPYTAYGMGGAGQSAAAQQAAQSSVAGFTLFP